MLISYESFYKQLGIKSNRTSFIWGNRSGHHNTKLRTQRHLIGQNAGHQYAQIYTQKNTLRHDFSYKQPEVKRNRTSFACGNRNGHPNTALGMQSRIIGQHKN